MDSINTNTTFSFSRFQLVLKRHVALNQRTWLTGFLSVAGFLFAIAVLPTMTDFFRPEQPGFTSIQGLTLTFYTLGGLILTSMMFNEVHSPTKAFQFLTLPSTTLEKLSAAWFTGTIIFTIISMLSIVGLSALIEIIHAFNTGVWNSFDLFNPFTENVLSTILSYFFYQSIFLFGAVYFKKNNFIKTVLGLVVFIMVIFITLNIALLIFGLSQNQEMMMNIQFDAQAWISPLQYLFGFGAAIFFIWLSYVQLKNKQVV